MGAVSDVGIWGLEKGVKKLQKLPADIQSPAKAAAAGKALARAGKLLGTAGAAVGVVGGGVEFYDGYRTENPMAKTRGAIAIGAAIGGFIICGPFGFAFGLLAGYGSKNF